MELTADQINAALSRAQEAKLTTTDAFAEMRHHGLPAELLLYAHELARANVARWSGLGEELSAVDGFAAGWLDGVMVGLELAKA